MVSKGIMIRLIIMWGAALNIRVHRFMFPGTCAEAHNVKDCIAWQIIQLKIIKIGDFQIIFHRYQW